MRPKVAVYIATSIDQYIARLDGGLDWLESVHVEGEDYGYGAFMDSVDAVLMGRNTWETVAGFTPWPYDGKRMVVLTHRPIEANHGEERHEGALGPLLDKLGAEGVRGVYIDGGVAISEALREGLVDTMILSIIPVMLGAGRPLFDGERPGSTWQAEGAKAFASGLVQVRWRRDSRTPQL